MNFKHLFTIALTITLSLQLFAQTDNVGVGTTSPDPSAVLDIQSADKGLRMPSMTSAQRDAIVSPAAGLIIYNTTDSCFNYYTGTDWFKDCGRRLYADSEILAISEGGTDDDYGKAIASDASGNLYVLGSFEGSATIGTASLTSGGSYGFSLFVAKYDATGNFIWVVQADDAYGNDIAIDGSGNILLTGRHLDATSFGTVNLPAPPGGYGEAAFVAKYDGSGTVQWAHSEGGNGMYAPTYGNSIAVDGSNNVIVTGAFHGTDNDFGGVLLSADENISSAFTIKYDASGVFQWVRSFSNIDYFCIGQGVATDGSGNIFITGGYGGTVDFGNGIIVTSTVTDEFFLLKYDASGNTQWVENADNFSWGREVATDASGNVYVAGTCSTPITFDATTLSTGNKFLMKYDGSGNVLWGQSATLGISDIDFDASGNPHLTGSFSGSASMGGQTINSTGNADLYIAKFNPSGTLQWLRKDGGSSDESSEELAFSNTNIFLTGLFSGTALLGGKMIPSTGGSDMFLVQYGADGLPAVPNTSLTTSQDNDADAGNELISGASLNGNTLEITDAGGTTSVDLSSIASNATTVMDGNTVDLTKTVNEISAEVILDPAGDNILTSSANGLKATEVDGSITNELQTISKSGSTVTLSNGGGSFMDDDTDADADPTNELQTISKSGNTVTLSDGGGSFTDAVNDADADPTNEIQTISKSGSTVTLSNGGGSFTDDDTDADADPTNEIQTISKSGNTVTLSNGGGSFTDDDTDPSNEYNTSVGLSGTTLNITDGGGTKSVDLSSIESDPQVGSNTTNYLPKWNGSALIQSNAVYENNSGDVGIGTTSLTDKLHVYSTIDDRITIESTQSGFAGFRSKTSNAEFFAGILAGRYAIFDNAASERLSINSAGNVGIGDTAPGEKLEVAGNINAVGGDLYAASSNGVFNIGGGIMNDLVNIIADINPTLTNVDGDEDLFVEDDLQVNSQAYKPGGGVWETTSDINLKKDINPYTDGLSKILQINPVIFKYNDVVPTYDSGKEYVGIIAQEIEPIAPYMVNLTPFGRKVKEDEEGNEIVVDPGTMYYTFDGNALTYMLINAVKEQQTIIEQQQADLEEKINTINEQQELLGKIVQALEDAGIEIN